jgi:arylsulfatase A-like enzyme
MRRHDRLRAVICVVVLVAATEWGCSDRGGDDEAGLDSFVDGPVVYDFVASFPAAERVEDTTLIDLETPVGRAHALGGWRLAQTPTGVPALLGVGRRSSLEFFQAEVGAVEATLRCKAIAAREWSVLLNGEEVTRVPLEAGWREYTVALPSDAMQRGRNLLQLEHGYGEGVRPLGPGFEPRQAAVECVSVRFETATGSRPPAGSIDAAAGQLEVTIGSRVDYHVQVPDRSAVTFRGPVVRGAPDARLELWVQQDGGTDTRIAHITATAGPTEHDVADEERAIELPGGGSRIMRISFRAVAGSHPPSPASAIRLAHPVIRSVSRPTRAAAARDDRVSRADRGQTNVFIYLIDTLRADHLGCYGDPRDISPHIDAFARDGVVFEHSIANSPWTKPSVASLFTGVWPATHNVLVKGNSLPQEAVTLAELLRAAGMVTAAFVANGHVSDRFGFEQGFSRFRFLPTPKTADQLPPTSVEVNVPSLDWIATHAAAAPLFVYVHTLDPHGPYFPPAAFRRTFASDVEDTRIGSRETLLELARGTHPVSDDLIRDLKALYGAEVAFNDESFGTFIAALRKHGLYDDALIVFLSDHGEAFHEHGTWQHGMDVYGEVVDIPLIIKFPARDGLAGTRVLALAQQIDVMPTILDYLGLPVPAHVEGHSLLHVLDSTGETGDGGALAAAAERTGFVHLNQIGRHQESIVTGSWKLIRNVGRPADPRYELYDRRVDPGEQEDVSDAHSIVVGYLRGLLALRRVRTGSVLTPTMGVTDPAVEQNLRALGYVE